ncbi:MAG: DUF2911 domain-containing protein [Algoriphagus sp.]|uniref:DUF2911 domain-containing protein n=1 Tax=Algoriphagus sp. TaxID=1872435 RepID=UPI001797DA8F|nr:DUF2911 domain-containing protein [Algoriphagus sp.]NVJ87440.1 DUF2911 domain-containing protein [Algoriphagus sp.]
MKKRYLIIPALLAILVFDSCGSKNSETAEDTSGTEMAEESTEQSRPSPLEVKEGNISGKAFKIQYGSPSVKGRQIWGDLVPYNVVWRTGANEATYIDLAEEMTVEGQSIAAGKYSLFTIPRESGDWTVILNSEWDLEHGHFQYDEKKDVLRVEVSPEWEETSQERLSIDIEEPGIVIRWEKLKLPIQIQ